MSGSGVYDSERVNRLAEISTKFHAHAAVGDTIKLGIEGDDQMPARYRGKRPTGTIVRIKNEGTEYSTLRVQLDTGRQIDIHPYQLGGDKVFEFDDKSWENVLARSNPKASEAAYRGSSGDIEISTMRQQMHDMRQEINRRNAESDNFQSAIVDAMAQITGEMNEYNPKAKFSKVFQEEYRSSQKNMDETPFHSDFEDD